MANVRINQMASHNYQVVESITEAKTLTKADCGKFFVIAQGAYTITLPKLSNDMLGWHIRIAFSTASDDDLTISTASGDEDLIMAVDNEDGSRGRLSDKLLYQNSSNISTGDIRTTQSKIFCYDAKLLSEEQSPAWQFLNYCFANDHVTGSG